MTINEILSSLNEKDFSDKLDNDQLKKNKTSEKNFFNRI